MNDGGKLSLYERIGAAFLARAITEFYVRAQKDGIIGHFFINLDISHITAMQIDFATALLGGPRNYRGKPLGPAHKNLKLRPPHFGRRQMLLKEVLDEMGLDPELRDAWLDLEEQLKPVVTGSC